MYYNTTNETGKDLKESHKKLNHNKKEYLRYSRQVNQHHHHK